MTTINIQLAEQVNVPWSREIVTILSFIGFRMSRRPVFRGWPHFKSGVGKLRLLVV